MTVVEWLSSLAGIRNVRPVSVTIGKQKYEGAYYEPERHYPGGVHRGRNIYLLGRVPKGYQKNSRECYVIEGEEHEWYVSIYADARCLHEPFKQFHPFGLSFQIAPWDVPGKIDDYERYPYRRVPATLTFLDQLATSGCNNER